MVSTVAVVATKGDATMLSMLLQVLPTTLPVVSSDTRFAAGWGTLSLVNAGLAQSKQRSGLLWWAFSLVLGPLATFLIVVLPRVKRPVP
jgi:hypothetical protein